MSPLYLRESTGTIVQQQHDVIISMPLVVRSYRQPNIYVKMMGLTLTSPPPRVASVTLYLGPDTMSGPTLSPVALLWSMCLPSHRGNVPDFQHLLSPHENNESGEVKRFSEFEASQCRTGF